MENPFELILEKLNTIEKLLKSENRTNLLDVIPKNEIFNVSQASKYLELSKSTVYKMTSERFIPHSKTGKRLYFWRHELDAWIAKHKIKTIHEIEKETDQFISKRKK